MLVLGIVRQLVEGLDAQEVPYCHWKSNDRIGEAVDGLTDLDLLVERSSSSKVLEVFGALGFKQFAPGISRAYPGVEDHLAVDPETGRLVHVHLHYQLIVGEKHLKGYRLPWERAVLAGRVWDDAAGIYVANPSFELLLLVVRAAMKHRFRDTLKALVRPAKKSGWYTEFDWLIRRPGVDSESVRKQAEPLLGSERAQEVADVVQRYIESASRMSLTEIRALRRSLRAYRRYSPQGGLVWRGMREFHWGVGAVNHKWVRRPVSLRRGVAHGGLAVAFLGSDGAGKSTVVNRIRKQFSSKFDVATIYFGSGDGPSSLIRRPLKWANRLRHRREGGGGEGGDRGEGKRGNPLKSLLYFVARGLWAVLVAREKHKNLKRLWRARNRGVLVICDRFPQTQIEGFNDGPLLASWSEHSFALARRLSRWERGIYEEASRFAPDLVVKLRVSPDVAVKRKPEMTVEETDRRDQAIAALRFPSSTDVESVNSDAELERVLAAVTAAIWRRL